MSGAPTTMPTANAEVSRPAVATVDTEVGSEVRE